MVADCFFVVPGSDLFVEFKVIPDRAKQVDKQSAGRRLKAALETGGQPPLPILFELQVICSLTQI